MSADQRRLDQRGEQTVCAFCSRVRPAAAAIHRDGQGVGPVVNLGACCVWLPTDIIWQRIAQPSTHGSAYKPVHVPFQSPGTTEVSSLSVETRR